MNLRNTVYYEVWKYNTEYIGTYDEIVNDQLQITYGIDTVPEMQLTIPTKNIPEENLSAYNFKVFIHANGEERYVFNGIVDTVQVDYSNYVTTLSLSHIIARMREWIMPVNYTVKNNTLSHILGNEGASLGSPSTIGGSQPYDLQVLFDIRDDAGELSLTFASSNKLEALDEVLGYTEKLHWYVSLRENMEETTQTTYSTIVIGEFGEQVDCEVSPMPPFEDQDCEVAPDRYVTMLSEPIFDADYTSHYNRAVVFCGEAGEGVYHLNLKDIYDDTSLQSNGFPVGMYDKRINLQPDAEYDEEGSVINNEQVYEDDAAVGYASNTNCEYYVTDTEQLESDGGVIKHTTFNFANLYPIPDLSTTDDAGNRVEYAITDDDRKEMELRAYQKAVRELKAQRPDHTYKFNCTRLPSVVLPGTKIHFLYSKTAYTDNDYCENYDEQLLVNIDEWLYANRMVISFDNALNEYTTITLDKEIKPRAIDAVEIELTQRVVESSSDSNSSISSSSSYNEGGSSTLNLDEISGTTGSSLYTGSKKSIRSQPITTDSNSMLFINGNGDLQFGDYARQGIEHYIVESKDSEGNYIYTAKLGSGKTVWLDDTVSKKLYSYDFRTGERTLNLK